MISQRFSVKHCTHYSYPKYTAHVYLDSQTTFALWLEAMNREVRWDKQFKLYNMACGVRCGTINIFESWSKSTKPKTNKIGQCSSMSITKHCWIADTCCFPVQFNLDLCTSNLHFFNFTANVPNILSDK